MTFESIPKITPAATASTNNNTNQGASYKGKGSFKPKWKDVGNYYCTICDNEGHYYHTCSSYPSVTDKKSALNAKGRCEDCATPKTYNHYCNLPGPCMYCKGKHKWQLCENKGNNHQR